MLSVTRVDCWLSTSLKTPSKCSKKQVLQELQENLEPKYRSALSRFLGKDCKGQSFVQSTNHESGYHWTTSSLSTGCGPTRSIMFISLGEGFSKTHLLERTQ